MKIGTFIVLVLAGAAIILVVGGHVDFDQTRREACQTGGALPGGLRGQVRFDHLVCR
jgi:hypothetical protein